MKYIPVAQFSGYGTRSIDLTSQLPWLYIIAATHRRLLYCGETNDQGGLIMRLGAHFGPFDRSTFRQSATRLAGAAIVKPPFLIVSAKLPFQDDTSKFDGSSKQIRLALEAKVHELLVSKFIVRNPDWTLVSNTVGSRNAGPKAIETTGENITDQFIDIFSVNRSLMNSSPFNLFLLNQEVLSKDEDSERDYGDIVQDIELMLFEWLLESVKINCGANWWTVGIPEKVRIECVTRREFEGEHERLPAEAYLSLIDFREIARKNWNLFSKGMETISGESGKDRATQWLVDLNEFRKLWAHPIKRRFTNIKLEKIEKLRGYVKALKGICANNGQIKLS